MERNNNGHHHGNRVPGQGIMKWQEHLAPAARQQRSAPARSRRLATFTRSQSRSFIIHHSPFLILLALLCLATAEVAGQDPIITEFMADNRNILQDQDGDYSDWIEIHNPGASAVSLAGWHLTDDIGNRTKWSFPAELIPAGGYLIVFASNKDRRIAGAELHTNFKIQEEGEYLALIRPDLQPSTEFYPQYPPQTDDVSYALIDQTAMTTTFVPAGGGVKWHVPLDGALGDTWKSGSFDDATWTNGPTALGFSGAPELMIYLPFDETAGATAADASGNGRDGAVSGAVFVTDGTRGQVLEFDSGDYVRAPFDQLQGAFTISLWAYWNGPAGGNDGLAQIQFGGNTPDTGSKIIGAWVNSAGPIWGRLIQSDFTTNNLPLTGASMPLGAWKHLVYRADGATYEVFVDGVATGPSISYDGTIADHNTLFVGRQGSESWNGLIDDFAVWNGVLSDSQIAALAGGAAPDAYSGFATLIDTDVTTAMFNANASSLYLRATFQIASTPDFDTLSLAARYDDGFAAWLNGSLLVNSNVGAAPAWDATALAARPNSAAAQFEEFDLTAQAGLLQTGTNVLAVQGVNVAGNDDDFLIEPVLEGGRTSGPLWLYSDQPTPGATNGIGYEGFVEDLAISPGRGYYTAPFPVSISTPTSGTDIWYTTDGSIPASNNPTASLYAAPLNVARTTMLRAIGVRTGWKPSAVEAHTYILIDDVLNQDPLNDPLAPTYPTIWQANVTGDYEMDPRITVNTASPIYEPTVPADLQSIPTLSIVMEHDDLWDPASGIYVDATRRGDAFRRPCSIEYFDPLGAEALQFTCGIQMHGSASRDNVRLLKHSFRLIFSEGFPGPNELDYPLFPDSEEDKFNTIVLRACFTDSFATRTIPGRYSPIDSQYLRDIWMRDSQLAMGHYSAHSINVHLFVNGLYWGLYNPSERADDAFMELYLGGNRGDYDIIKDFNELIHGNKLAWDAMFALARTGLASDAAYQAIQGNDPDGTPNPALPNYLDVDNLIDFMMLHIFAGVEDWPSHNWYAARDRVTNIAGFRFFVWDQEIALDNLARDRSDVNDTNTPAELYSRLRANAEFRVRFGDRVHKQMFNGGALSIASNQARYQGLADRVERAIICESARWGDARESVIGQVMTIDDWLFERDEIIDNYLPAIHDITIARFRNDGLYPPVNAPVYSQHGGSAPINYNLTMTHSNASGAIYFTTDGSDPRLTGGGVSGSAQLYANPVALTARTTVKARVLDGLSWSALNAATFQIVNSPIQMYLRVTELHYHPADATPAEVAAGFTNRDDFEFIELLNAGTTQTLDLSNVAFTDGIDFAFTTASVTMLAPGARVLIVKDRAAFAVRYSARYSIAGAYVGNFSNGGERVELTDATFGLIQEFTYDDEGDWPAAADGGGPSLEVIDINGNYNDPFNWRASAVIGGTPQDLLPPQQPAGAAYWILY